MKITGANGELVALGNQLDAVNADIKRDIDQMADGVAAGLIGAGVAAIFVGGFTILGGGVVSSAILLAAGVGAIIEMGTKGAAQFSSNIIHQRKDSCGQSRIDFIENSQRAAPWI